MNQVAPELQFLEENIFHDVVNLPMQEITAYDRYSFRMTI